MRKALNWAISVTVLALFLAAFAVQGAQRAAEVVSVQGVGEGRADEKAPWKAVAPKQELFANNFVRTGAFSRMGLLFADRTQVRLAEKTVLMVKAVGQETAEGSRSVLRLEQGRSWSQTNAVPANLYIETPSATAAIRGTDWEIEVTPDGRSLLTVFSGEVAFFNDFGTVSVRRNEQAEAVPGRAPVKRLLANPRDRVQWVTAFSVDPLRHIAVAADGAAAGTNAELGRLARIVELVRADRLEEAYAAAQAAMAAIGATQPAAWLIASDLMIYQGRLDRASEHARAGLAVFRDDPRLVAQLARIDLAAGRFDAAARGLSAALASAKPAFEVRLAGADLARAKGEGDAARAGFEAARAERPGDDRPWYGLGVIDSEREAVAQARANLGEALARNPGGAGYLGELGTLESFANDFPAADAAFRGALERNAADYIALTGLGVLELKRGDPDKALESFLRASLLEPRYARVHMYTAVAHWQRRRGAQALAELAKAIELDDKDPLPHLLASMIQTDLFRVADAVESARHAMRLLPFLKSLNQIANDRQGSANLGRSLSFFGLEDWAQNRAQESYYPYWAGSHLFLSDRYPGEYNKNSELLQGFLADPTVFGASNRFQSLVARPGDYGRLLFGYSRGSDLNASLPVVRVNGMGVEGAPAAYLVDVDRPRFHFTGDTRGSSDGHTLTAAAGVRPTHELGLFIYGFDQRNDGDNVFRTGGTVAELVDSQKTSLVNVGLHYKLGPQSQVWARASSTRGKEDSAGTINGTPITSTLDSRLPEYAFRHTFDAGAHQFTWGYEHAHKKAANDWTIETETPGIFAINFDRYDERSRAFFASDSFDVTTDLLVQLDLWWQENLRTRTANANIGIPDVLVLPLPGETEIRDFRKVTPRVGVRYRVRDNVLVRAAYQDWSRPAGLSTLGPVATAGIPMDDRLVSRGGRLKRFRGQVEVEASPRLYASAFADYKEIDNRRFALSPFIVTEDENLTKLKDFDFGRLGAGDLYEFIRAPEFDAGRVGLAGLAVNGIATDTVGLSARYVYTRSENTGIRYADKLIAYHPRHTAAFGITWASASRIFFASKAVYRTLRYTDEENLVPYRPGWDLACDLFWESADKRARLRLGVDNGLHRERHTQYSATIVLNF